MKRTQTDALIVDAVRSPIGKKNGTLSHIRGDDLSAQVVNGLLARHDVDPGEVEDLQWGCVTQVEEQAWNIGRNVALTAGWPVSVCGTTVDRQCGSSMQTNFNAAAAVWSGQLDLVVSGGVEMMSRVPMGSNRGSMSDLVLERFDIVMQGISAEEIAKEWKLSREEADRYSYESHQRAARAIDEGRFEKEIIPIELDVPAPDEDGGGTATMTRTRFAVDEAHVGRHRADRGERGVRVGRAPVPPGHEPRRALGGRRREPERRRHLARPPARCDRSSYHRDARLRARAAQRPLRHRGDVHRLRPGDRGGHRAPVGARRRESRSCGN